MESEQALGGPKRRRTQCPYALIPAVQRQEKYSRFTSTLVLWATEDSNWLLHDAIWFPLSSREKKEGNPFFFSRISTKLVYIWPSYLNPCRLTFLKYLETEMPWAANQSWTRNPDGLKITWWEKAPRASECANRSIYNHKPLNTSRNGASGKLEGTALTLQTPLLANSALKSVISMDKRNITPRENKFCTHTAAVNTSASNHPWATEDLCLGGQSSHDEIALFYFVLVGIVLFFKKKHHMTVCVKLQKWLLVSIVKTNKQKNPLFTGGFCFLK